MTPFDDHPAESPNDVAAALGKVFDDKMQEMVDQTIEFALKRWGCQAHSMRLMKMCVATAALTSAAKAYAKVTTNDHEAEMDCADKLAHLLVPVILPGLGEALQEANEKVEKRREAYKRFDPQDN